MNKDKLKIAHVKQNEGINTTQISCRMEAGAAPLPSSLQAC